MFRALLILPWLAAIAAAQAPEPEAAAPVDAKPAVERIDEDHFRIGGITFNQKTREIRFPASINMAEGLLEFLIVHQNGKVHESLLKTAISPLHLNLAFKLLRYPASIELHTLPNTEGGVSDEFPKVPEEIRAAARVAIHVEWKDGDRLRKLPVNEWVQHSVTATTMEPDPWVYGGSEIAHGKFAAEATGNVAAIYITSDSLLNYSGKDNRDDTVWFVFPKRVPPVDTPVTVIISPLANAKPIPKS